MRAAWRITLTMRPFNGFNIEFPPPRPPGDITQSVP